MAVLEVVLGVAVLEAVPEVAVPEGVEAPCSGQLQVSVAVAFFSSVASLATDVTVTVRAAEARSPSSDFAEAVASAPVAPSSGTAERSPLDRPVAIAPATASGAGGVGVGVQAATPPVSVPSASAAPHARDRRTRRWGA